MYQVYRELQRERARAYGEVRRLDSVIRALKQVVTRNGFKPEAGVVARRPRRRISAAGRKRIAAAQKARWAKIKAQHAKKTKAA